MRHLRPVFRFRPDVQRARSGGKNCCASASAIVLGGSEFTVEPEKITDCAAWVSARLIDRYALLRAKQDGKAAATGRSPRREACRGCLIGLRTGAPYPPGGRRTPYGQPGGQQGQPGGARPMV